MFEIVLILLLILANGFFSCAEMAVITARQSNITPLSEEGKQSVSLLQQLQNDPERFLSTIQIGVTLFGSAAAAVGGASAVELIRPWVEGIPYIGTFSRAIALTIVVCVISYLSLVLGELVPKALALKYPGPIALVAAKPFYLLSQTLRPAVNFLTVTVLFFMKPFGGKIVPRSFASEEEIKWLLKEGQKEGVFDQTEQELIRSVFEFNDISVKEVMIPRPKIHAIQIDTPREEVMAYLQENKFSRYPVYKNNLNEIVGILLFKDLLTTLTGKKPFVLSELLTSAYFVPETMQVSHLLKEFQRRRAQMAIVVNEYGLVDGLVTMEDLVEEIVGEIHDESDVEERPVERLRDGSWVVDASFAIRELISDYDLHLPESPDYETIGGFVLAQMQALPKPGEIVRHGEYKFTVVDMDGHRVSKVKVEKETEKVSPIV